MLSQTTEYALRAMAILAYAPGELVPTAKIAEETRVPPNYLAKVLQQLAGAGLIEGRRGVGGGYQLAKPARQISMLDAVRAVENVNRITTCPLGLPSHGANLCPLHRKLDSAIAAVHDVFAETTLHDLISQPGVNRPICETNAGGGVTDLGVSAPARRNTPEG